MKIIKKGKPYRKHKCKKCKTIYIYEYKEAVNHAGVVHCPCCNNFFDTMCFDKKLSKEQVDKLIEVK